MKNNNRKELAEMYYDLVPTVIYGMLSKPVYNKYRDSIDDFLGEGYETLVKAANDYDPRKGVKFKSYASLRIRGVFKNQAKKMYDEEVHHVNLESIREVDLSDRIEELKPEVSVTDLIEGLEPQNSKMYREIYYRIILGDNTHQEVADILKTNRSNIRLMKSRLLKKLKKQLIATGEYNEYE